MGTLAKIFLPSLDWRTKALRGNFGKEFPAILGLTNKSSTWELWQRFSCHPWTDEQKLYMGTLVPKDFPAILGLTNKSSMWELWQRFSCHPWTVEQKLYVRTLAKIFLPSLDWWMAKIFLPSLDWWTKNSIWKHWQRFSVQGWQENLPSLDCRMAKIFLPSLDCRTKALCGNIGKDFPAILGLMNKSSTWEHWKRFFCHPWTDKQKLYVGTLAKIFLSSLDWRTKAFVYVGTLAKILLPSLDWRTKALRGNFGKDFPAILGLTNESSTWELWQRFSCHPWTDERKLYVGTLAKIFLPSLGLSNKSSTWELWQRFSCHPWTVEQKLYVRTLAKIFLPSLDWWMAKIFPAILGLTNKKLYLDTLAKIFLPSLDCRMAKIFLPSLDCRTKLLFALCGNIGKDFPAILGLSKKSSMWEHWQRFFCHPWTDEQKLYVGTLEKIFLPSLDWRTKALHRNFGKDFPAILRLSNKNSLRGNIGKDFPAILRLSNGTDFPAILGLSNKSSMWEHWQRFSCHPWNDEQKLYVGTLVKIFLPS